MELHHYQAPSNLTGPTRIERGAKYPLSYSQSVIWHYQLLVPGAPEHFWHIPLSIRIRGEFHPAALQEAYSWLIARHDAFRTTFRVLTSGEPVQQIAVSSNSGLDFLDLHVHSTELRNSEAERLLQEMFRTPFDLADAPPIRIVLLRLDEHEHVFFAVIHHIIADAWSLNLFIRELVADYQAILQGRPSEVAEPRLQYIDYAVWQRQQTENGGFDAMIDYWVGQLTPPFLNVGLTTRKPLEPTTPYAGGIECFALEQGIIEQADQLARVTGGTVFSVFLAAFYGILHAHTGSSDLLVSVAAANRPGSCLRVFGCFAKHLPYRVRFEDDPSFEQMVRRVQDVNRGAQANQAPPIMKAVEQVLATGAPQASAPMATFIFQNAIMPMSQIENVSFDFKYRWDLFDFARGDMIWQFNFTSEGLEVLIEYRTSRYSASFVKSLAKEYVQFLSSAFEEPSRLLSSFAVPKTTDIAQVCTKIPGFSDRSPA